MRFWLLTNTTYGTWLPGDRRGSVTSVRDRRPSDAPGESRVEHDKPGEVWEGPLPTLHRSAQALMKGPPIYFKLAQAELLLRQFQETAGHRGWTLHAVAIMANHVHLVVEVADDPDPDRVLSDFKAYGMASRLRRLGGRRRDRRGSCHMIAPSRMRFTTCSINSRIRWSFGRWNWDDWIEASPDR